MHLPALLHLSLLVVVPASLSDRDAERKDRAGRQEGDRKRQQRSTRGCVGPGALDLPTEKRLRAPCFCLLQALVTAALLLASEGT